MFRTYLAVLSVAAVNLFALPTGFNQKDLVTGLDAVSSAVLPDGRILAIEKFGKVTVVKNGVKLATPFMNWESKTMSRFEKGMMGILADPNFGTNGYIYVWYCDKRQGGNGQDRVSRFNVVGDTVDGNSEKLMISLGDAGQNYHHGSGLSVGPDGKLWIASGCRGNINDGSPGPENASNKGVVEGKMLRINLDGTIPTDNPFYTTNTGDARAVYYWGLRNPFTMSWRGDKLWFSDVQSGSGDDKVVEGGAAGTDYGFQNRGGAASLWNSNKAGTNTRAMIGSLWYKGANFPTEWQDLYYFGGVAGGGYGDEPNVNLLAYGVAHSGSPKVFGSFKCPIDVKQDAVGAMYVTVRCQTEDARYTDGKVIKVWYGDTEPPTSLTPEKQSSFAALERMKWSMVAGRLVVSLNQGGAQSLELRTLSGKLLAKKDFAPGSDKGMAEFAVTARGTHLLVWKSGSSESVTKVVL
jgi:glucose/arabinose dehydrogenase